MFSRICSVFCCLLLGEVLCVGALDMNKKFWDYTLISIEGNSTDEEWLRFELKVDRIGRGEYGISGNIVVGTPLDGKEIEVKAYRSASGSASEYKLLPFKVEKQTAESFMENIYKKMLMSSVAECSNAPQCAEDEIPMYEQTTYTLNRCQISTEKFPSHLMSGFYKVIATVSGPYTAIVEIMAEVVPKEY